MIFLWLLLDVKDLRLGIQLGFGEASVTLMTNRSCMSSHYPWVHGRLDLKTATQVAEGFSPPRSVGGADGSSMMNKAKAKLMAEHGR